MSDDIGNCRTIIGNYRKLSETVGKLSDYRKTIGFFSSFKLANYRKTIGNCRKTIGDYRKTIGPIGKLSAIIGLLDTVLDLCRMKLSKIVRTGLLPPAVDAQTKRRGSARPRRRPRYRRRSATRHGVPGRPADSR